MENKTRKTQLKRFQISRKNADSKLFRLKNVVGSCLGFKIKGGIRSKELCVTVFVSRKVQSKGLTPKNRIPKTVRRHGLDLPTDVIALGNIRQELGFSILDGTQVGTVGCFARVDGQYFALTCAHCITGRDGDFNTPDLITIDFPSPGMPLSLGMSAGGLQFQGIGIFPDYGDFDGGIVSVCSPAMTAYVRSRPPLEPFRPSLAQFSEDGLRQLLEYSPVQGWGAGTDNVLRGQVHGVFATIAGYRYDLVIGSIQGSGLTSKGDSGMVWLNSSGEALGIHMAGDGAGPGGTSQFGFAQFAFRLSDRFRARLLTA